MPNNILVIQVHVHVPNGQETVLPHIKLFSYNMRQENRESFIFRV